MIIAVLAILAVFLGVSALRLFTSSRTSGQVLMAEWQEEAPGRYAIHNGHEKAFRFDGHSDRVLVADTPEFHFGSNQDFSVEAWIKAYPTSSRLAQRLVVWFQGHPGIGKVVPKWLAAWISAQAVDNDFGVMPILDKHHTPSTIESIGFQFYLDHGRLACQLSQPPLRALGFQNFISPAPTLQDGHWHYVAMSVKRTSVTGGRLYVDGHQVLIFDPTAQTGDLSNSEPLRIGNHANPTLRCFFKGAITGVALHRRVLPAEEIDASYAAGRPR